jgi:hypothetical protein
MVTRDQAEKIQDYIAKQAMKSPEWAIAYALIEISWSLRYVGDYIGGPMDDCGGINRIGAQLERIADRMQGLETDKQRAFRKMEERMELRKIERFEDGEEGVKVIYKNGQHKFMGKVEAAELYVRWKANGGGA